MSRPSAERIWKRYLPPTRASNFSTFPVKPRGPSHCAMRAGSVQARQTKSLGASKTRTRTSSRSACAASALSTLPAAIAVLLPLLARAVRAIRGLFGSLALNVDQIIRETIETLLPEAPILFQPVDRRAHRRGLEPARPQLRLPPALDKSGALEDFEMLRYRRQAYPEGLAQVRNRGFARGKSGEDRAAGGIGEGGKGGGEIVVGHI